MSEVLVQAQPRKTPTQQQAHERSRVSSGFGPLSERIGMLAVLRPHERVLVLLQLLGGQ